jgi:hypothetical protein
MSLDFKGYKNCYSGMLGSSGHDSQSLEVLIGTDGCAAELARLASGKMVDRIVSDCDSNEAYDFGIVS